MATTLVQVRNAKRVIYVGGLDDGVTEAALHAAFLPFGDIKDVSMPVDGATGRHRGFGFVEYDEADDAAAAVANMDAGEFFGRTLRVNVAQGGAIAASGKGGGGGQPVWADADRYLDELEREQALERADAEGAAARARERTEAETAAAVRAEAEAEAAVGGGKGGGAAAD